MKRGLALFLSLVMLLTMLPFCAAAEESPALTDAPEESTAPVGAIAKSPALTAAPEATAAPAIADVPPAFPFGEGGSRSETDEVSRPQAADEVESASAPEATAAPAIPDPQT